MSTLKKYSWEGTLIVAIGGVITVLTLVTHLTARAPDGGTPGGPKPAPGPTAFHPIPDRVSVASTTPPAVPRKTVKARFASSKPSDPLEVIIGPSSISGRFRLLAVDRTPATEASDKLTLRLRVVSRAMADLVTPFQSAMLEVRVRGLEPINPERAFSEPVPAGNSREEDIAFVVPSSVNLDRAVLRVHYYNEQKEIPLAPLLKDSRH